jgi:diketogulonate reductase-like aldo/keto reductase
VTNEEAIFHAIKVGYTNLDTAAFYENEEAVGRQVKRANSELGLKREDLFISSKIWIDTMGYEKTVKAVEIALAKLDIGYIDLMFMHFPVNNELPPEYPNHEFDRNESWRALEEFVEKGLIRHLGISNFLPHHIESLLKVAKIPPSVNQFELHPLYQELDTIECCKKHDIIVQSYSPFA